MTNSTTLFYKFAYQNFIILEAQMAQKKYHQEFNPPPEGSVTGVQNQEQITYVADPAYDEQQVLTN